MSLPTQLGLLKKNLQMKFIEMFLKCLLFTYHKWNIIQNLEVVSGVFESFHFEPEGIVHNENLSMESIFYHICVNSGLLTYY